MAQFRPAGLSDEDTNSDDDYGFYEKPVRRYYSAPQQNPRKKIELNLQDAIINGNLKEVEKIVVCDIQNNVNIKLDSGWTPLMHACFHAQDKIVKYLLDHGADPNLHADSVTPVMAACSNSSANNDTIYNIITYLLEKDCLLNVGDKYGQTPLMRAISSGRVAVVQKLLEKDVNIEMRDQHGWTAIFWAAHHNQPEILEMLVANGARLKEVDKSGRTIVDIANAHEYQSILEILNNHIKSNQEQDEADKSFYLNNLTTTWHDYYPGMKKGEKPNYSSEIPNLLYGMSCERLTPLIHKSGMDLRTFLLLKEKDMIKLGIDMPYERTRLRMGLRNFHKREWKLNSVVGLYAQNSSKYGVLDCLTTLGSHLQQTYILEATLQYVLREYNSEHIQNQIKFEPPDSPSVVRIKLAAKKLICNINNIRKEMKHMKNLLSKISKNNPQPADLIKEKSWNEIVLSYISEAVVMCSLGVLVYQAKSLFSNFAKK